MPNNSVLMEQLSETQQRLVKFLEDLKKKKNQTQLIRSEKAGGQYQLITGYISETELISKLMDVYQRSNTSDILGITIENIINTVTDSTDIDIDLGIFGNNKKTYRKINLFNITRTKELIDFFSNTDEVVKEKLRQKLIAEPRDDENNTIHLLALGISTLGILSSMYRQGGKKQKRRRTNKNVIVKNKQKRRRNKSQKKRLSRKKR